MEQIAVHVGSSNHLKNGIVCKDKQGLLVRDFKNIYNYNVNIINN
jgi:hypothetical protein